MSKASAAKQDYNSQQTLLEIILRIAEEEGISLIEAATQLSESLDLEPEVFISKCGDTILEFLKKDAISNNMIHLSRQEKGVPTIDSLFA